MSSTITAPAATAPHLLSSNTEYQVQAAPPSRIRHDLVATFNYYKDPGDGSLPAPTIIGKPETYERPAEPLSQPVHDIRGEEDSYSLDTTGFQIYKHTSQETAFEDDDQIKSVYYPEIEEILKSA